MANKIFANTKNVTHSEIRALRTLAQSIVDMCNESLEMDNLDYDSILRAVENIYPHSKILIEESSIQRYIYLNTKKNGKR